MEYKVHRKEIIYYFLMAAISICFYIPLANCVIISPDRIALMVTLFFFVSFISFILCISKICFLGFLRGNAIKVTPSQFPKLFDILKSHCQKLGINSIPNTYVLQGNGILNAFAAKMLGNNIVILNSGVVELIDDNQYDVVSFIIGHELGHIKRGHVSSFKMIFILPANLIVPLRLAYSRACEYTCDNIGYNLCPAGAVNGMLFLACGAKLYKKVDTKELLLSFAANSGGTSFAEIFSTHPLLIKRVRVLNNLNKQNLHVDSFTFNTPRNTKFEELS